MSTPDNPDVFDGLERAAPGEPVFTLCAHDDQAPGLVRQWVDARREAILSANLPRDRRMLELKQCQSAEMVLFDMIDWRAAKVRPFDDSDVEAPPLPYSGRQATAEEIAETNRAQTLREAIRLCDNAVAAIADAAKLLEQLDYGNYAEMLSHNRIGVFEIADEIRPRRRPRA